MTTNLNADTINFKAVSGHKPRADIQVNHAAVAACLCALVLIGILLSPSIFSFAPSTSLPSSVNQEIEQIGHTVVAKDLGTKSLNLNVK